tara:strand:+ start:8789 stop:8938 length:150 start_codon:yes stop_codon:yes gene_type:complete
MWIGLLNTILSISDLPGQGEEPGPGDLEIITELGINVITEDLGAELIIE